VKIVTTFAAAREAGRGVIGLVPTMGYLHEGHLSLMHSAREACDTVVVSLFVNPLQFAPSEDLGRYPADLDRDAAMAEEAGVDVLFAPPLEEMYPGQPSTRVSVEALSLGLEGKHRPGHLEGVATVVTKLFAGLQPQLAYFGRKDGQQLAVVRRLGFDLSFPIEVVGGSTVREQDGLALSSRNTYLSAADRDAARSLSAGLFAAAALVDGGERDAAALEDAVVAQVASGGAELEDVELADAQETIRRLRLDRECFLAVAARVGPTRLIDNVWFDPVDGGFVPDRGVRLTAPSLLYAPALRGD
jgi:pantoate--beta-alanine ligase